MKKRKLFCELSPTCYKLSLRKEYVLRDIHDLFSKEKFASEINTVPLPVVVKSHSSDMLRKLHVVDEGLQRSKAENLRLAAAKINGIVIRPKETFSFWRLVGEPSEKRGYKPGLVISKGRLEQGIGGGLCQLANLIHWLVLNSPLTVTELNHHSDALFPDSGRRVPFGTGTSVFYKNVDYRFCNTTDRPVQLLVWTDGERLCGELRAQTAFPYIYRVTEENYGYVEEDGVFYRVSRVYRLTLDKQRRVMRSELILNNHSKVMYDYSLIPPDQIITPCLRRLTYDDTAQE